MDLQEGAKVCKHCGKDLVKADTAFYSRPIGCATFLGVFFALAGFFFWPLWILAVLLFILAAVTKS
jgi:fatty acid desaturase